MDRVNQAQYLVGYVAPDTVVFAGCVNNFRYTSKSEIALDDEFPERSTYSPYHNSRARWRNASRLQLPVSAVYGERDRAAVSPFGYKNVYELVVVNQETQKEQAIVATKKQNFLVWRGGFERLQVLQMGSVLVMEGGVQAVVQRCTYKGYLPVNEVILGDGRPYLANGFVCRNVHIYKKRKPAESYGIIGYRQHETESGAHDLQLLIIRRKHTMGFMDLVRGRFYNKKMDDIVCIYLSEMTHEERLKVMTFTFDELWEDIWANHKSKSYRDEYAKAKRKYAKLSLKHLLDDVPCTYVLPEYGFPKGRKNTREDCIGCAKREFEEETGVKPAHYTVLRTSPTFEEKFTATNGVVYRHIYYLARIDDDAPTPTVNSHIKQAEEVASVEWRTPSECLQMFRPYDTSKLQVTRAVNEYLTTSLHNRG